MEITITILLIITLLLLRSFTALIHNIQSARKTRLPVIVCLLEPHHRIEAVLGEYLALLQLRKSLVVYLLLGKRFRLSRWDSLGEQPRHNRLKKVFMLVTLNYKAVHIADPRSAIEALLHEENFARVEVPEGKLCPRLGGNFSG